MAKTTRLYYGLAKTGEPLYWTLKVKNATRSVALNGTVLDAMSGEAGLSIGCHLSKMAERNSKCFDHPALYISFTKSVALVITKIAGGKPTQCVRYRHNYSRYVDLNDKDPTKKIVREHPELFNRQFMLRPYTPQENHWKPEYGRKETGERSKFRLMSGEIDRMRNAGLVVQGLTT